jgi:polyisoprenoid-binding protein YceI
MEVPMMPKVKPRLLVLVAAATALAFVVPTQAAETWKIDPVHTEVMFAVSHLGVSTQYGRFNDISGTVMLDAENPENSSIELELKAASIDTGAEKRDEHLRGPDFFNAKQFPVITFESTSIEKTGADTFEITGELSMHGKSKPLTVTFERMGTAKNPRGETVTGGTTSFTIKRSEFGVDYLVGPVGDEVELMISVEAIKQ